MGSIQYEQDMNYSSILRKLDGNSSSSARVIIAEADAASNLAMDSSGDERSETHMVYWTGVNKKRVFPSPSYLLTEDGKGFVLNKKADLQRKCGDSFISEIEYGASLFVTLKIEYMNSSDKFQSGAGFKVDLKTGIFKSEENLSKLDLDLKKRTRLSLVIRQLGGDPTALIRIVPAEAITCTLDNLEPCMNTFEKVMEYLKGDFAKSLEITDDQDSQWNIINYGVRRYDESGLEILTPTGGFISPSPETIAMREKLEKLYATEVLHARRADMILNNGQFIPYLSDKEIVQINNIRKTAIGNTEQLAKFQRYCDENVLDCAGKIKGKLYSQAVYDASILSVELGTRRSKGDLNYYNIVGGYEYGSKFDDTNLAIRGGMITSLDFAAKTITGDLHEYYGIDSQLTGIRVNYADGSNSTHGRLDKRQTQTLVVGGDQIRAFTVCYDANSNIPTPRVVGISVTTHSSQSLSVGNLLMSKCTTTNFENNEAFIGFVGSSGADVDSLGLVTRIATGR